MTSNCSREISDLVEKHISQIKVACATFEDIYIDASFDAACLEVLVPPAMLNEYVVLKNNAKNKTAQLPDAAWFWKETGLCDRLRQSHAPYHHGLADVLDWLGGNVDVRFEKIYSPRGMILLRVVEEHH